MGWGSRGCGEARKARAERLHCALGALPRIALLACLAAGWLGIAGMAQARTHRRAATISRARADLIALKALHGLRYTPVVFFGLPRPLPAGTRIGIDGSGRAGAGRLRVRAWLFWADLQPGYYFDHAGSLVLVAARGGRVLMHEPTLTWPLVDGRTPAFLRTRGGYDARRYRVLARGGGASQASLVATRALRPFPALRSPGVAALRPAAALRPPAVAAAGSGARCMIVVGPPPNVLDTYNPLQMFTWGGHLNDADQMAALAQRLGVPVRRAYDLAQLRDELALAPQQGCTDVLVFITGEGSPAPVAIPGPLRGVLGGRRYFPVYGSADPNVELGPNGGKITAAQLAQALQGAYSGAPAGAKPNFTLMLQQCFAGRMLDAVGKVTGVGAVATSSSATTEASRYPSGIPRGASPWVNAMTDGLLSAAQGAAGKVLSWGDAVGQAFNSLPASADIPQLDVHGTILSKAPAPPQPACSAQAAYDELCQGPSGQVAVQVSVSTGGDPTGAGTVTIQPPGETVSFPLVSAAGGPWFFYAAEGSAVTFTVNHAAGSYLDGIQTQNGARCDGQSDDGTLSGQTNGGSPEICTFTVTGGPALGTTLAFSATVRAFFYPCPPAGTIFSRPGEMVDCPQG